MTFIKAASQHGPLWFYESFKPRGTFDFDRAPGGWRQWDYAGNFAFGAGGAAQGIPDYALQSVGGADQWYHGTSGPFSSGQNGNWAGIPFLYPPFGDTKSGEIGAGEDYFWNCPH